MLWDASSTTPVTPAADQIDGACAPAPAAHAKTNTPEMSDMRLCGIGIHLSCLTVLTNGSERSGTYARRRRVQPDGQRRRRCRGSFQGSRTSSMLSAES